jgi:hypothetical protein
MFTLGDECAYGGKRILKSMSSFAAHRVREVRGQSGNANVASGSSVYRYVDVSVHET